MLETFEYDTHEMFDTTGRWKLLGGQDEYRESVGYAIPQGNSRLLKLTENSKKTWSFFFENLAIIQF